MISPEEKISIEAAKLSEQLLPTKSAERYTKEYNLFCKWRQQKNINTVSDDILLVYLSESANSTKASTLCSRYSMLKSCLAVKENTDVSKFSKTIAFLKRKSVGYTPNKSKVLSADEVAKFITEAPDHKWLLAKIILIFGIYGACRRDDLIRLTLEDVTDNGNFLVVFIRDGKAHRSRSFTITKEGCPFDPCALYRKYIKLRPKEMASRRLFVAYRNGRCYAQPVGCHTISGTTKQIAEYLNLENPEQYTGHGLRRSSASMLVEGGGDLLTLKRLGGWRSSTVAEGYIEESTKGKLEISRKLFNQPAVKSSTSIPENILVCDNNAPSSTTTVLQNEVLTKERSFNRLEACRTCLGLINVDNSPFFEIEADDMHLSAESCRHKLLSIVPEMALNITPKSMLCAECHCSLQALFEFKKKCLKTENILAQYIQTKLDLDIKNLDLKEVSAFNAADIEISENKSFEEVFVDEFTVKEEVELCDTSIVKQEVDDFSLENVEVVQPKNAVPGFLADINISEEEAAEASLQDVVVKKEVESYDPVITNVKHEDVNLYQSKMDAKVETFNPLRIHTGKPSKTCKKTHRCEICDCRFVGENHLAIHLRTHNGEKPYRCDKYHRRFAHKSNPTSHLSMHTSVKSHRCKICGKRFTLKNNLKVHMRSHTGDRRFVCTFCDKSCPSNSSLKVHIRNHTGERPYRCELCDRSFMRKSVLSNHLQVHGSRSAPSAAKDPLQD